MACNLAFPQTTIFSSSMNETPKGFLTQLHGNLQVRNASTKTSKWFSCDGHHPNIIGNVLVKVPTRKQAIVRATNTENSEHLSDLSEPADVIRQFYDSINSRNFKKLAELISNDCFYEDESYQDPFQGKKEVMKFLTELAESMGNNVNLVVDRTFEGKDLTVGVLWHMEWKENLVPFSRGCSVYDCCEQHQKLVIKKCYSLVEAPIKPGSFVLKLLKIVRSFFDRFPFLAENIILKCRDVFNLIFTLIKKFVEPFILSVFGFYSNLWKFVSPLIFRLLELLLQVLKMMIKQDK